MKYNLTPVNRLFDNFFGTNGFQNHLMDFGWPVHDHLFEPEKRPANWAQFKVKEANGGYVIEAELAGVKKDDLKIEVAGGALTISGKRGQKLESGQSDKQTVRAMEYSEFTRSFSLGDEIDTENIEAHFENGYLTLNLPRTVKKARNIELK